MIYLHRAFNNDIVTDDNDPVYKASINLVIALATYASQHVERVDRSTNMLTRGFPKPESRIELWRIRDASEVVFLGFTDYLDMNELNSYLARLSKRPLIRDILPDAYTTYARRMPLSDSGESATARYVDSMISLAHDVFGLAHVNRIKSCTEFPVLWTPKPSRFRWEFRNFFYNRKQEKIEMTIDNIFGDIVNLVTRRWSQDSSYSSMLGEMPPGYEYRNSFNQCFLASDFSWSFFFDTVKEKDPAEVEPELLHVKKGIPTNSVTGDQKSFLRDGVTHRQSQELDSAIMKGDFLPRTVATAFTEGKYWTTTSTSFNLILRYRVKPSSECRHSVNSHRGSFDCFIGYEEMLLSLWTTNRTAPCSHNPPDLAILTAVDSDTVTTMALSDFWPLQERSEAIVVLLTRNDPRMRWLAIASIGRYCRRNFDHTKNEFRKIMLRTDRCCDACALAQIKTKPARWFLVL